MYTTGGEDNDDDQVFKIERFSRFTGAEFLR